MVPHSMAPGVQLGLVYSGEAQEIVLVPLPSMLASQFVQGPGVAEQVMLSAACG